MVCADAQMGIYAETNTAGSRQACMLSFTYLDSQTAGHIHHNILSTAILQSWQTAHSVMVAVCKLQHSVGHKSEARHGT